MAEEQPQTPPKPQPNPSSSVEYEMEVPLQKYYRNFSLQKAVCSHGLFCMAPNKWDPLTKSLMRPLRLSPSFSAMVHISQLSGSLLVRVYGVEVLSEEERETVEGQVRRMLRLSDHEERKVREFQQLHAKAKEDGFGRVFRSPSLFEDMVKSILFCNCQWPRTLNMAKALCDLQLELQHHSSKESVNTLGDGKLELLTPATPAVKESRRKHEVQTVSREETIVAVDESEGNYEVGMSSAQMANTIKGLCVFPAEMVGNFPSPEEIASLDEKYLAKRCGLGYRAGRILKLAQGVVEGRIQISQLEELCSETDISNCVKVEEKLKEIFGYGPVTRGNVLICMGFYNIVPTDSETIRHLNQFHAIKTTVKTVQKVIEEIYRKYEPYQFLAYWWEVWSFYERRFGKFSDMPSSHYNRVTANNMKITKGKAKKTVS